MIEYRPNPNVILKQILEKEQDRRCGRLKIFFGYAAGVGKTFAMLEAAHEAKRAGIDVVAGYIEHHMRIETAKLLEGLELLPNREINYKGITLNEFDLDGAISRKPELILVDELAHSNAENCRHVKRYQDIKELLNNGINVYTTVNVQHIESLNDIVASITGIIVRERVPDSIFDEADQIELVDIEPENLIIRLNQGKIYKENQAKKALANFFTEDKLIALREIALRRTADAINKKIEKENTKNNYYTEEHILICLSSSPSNAKVIRTAARLAASFNGLFTALFVETTHTKELEKENKIRLEKNLKLAEQLGARIDTVYGDDVANQVSQYAKISRVSKIVIGRSNNRRGWFINKKTLMDRLSELVPNIDIYIIPDNSKKYNKKIIPKIEINKFTVIDMAKTLGILALTTILGLIFYDLGYGEANIITMYILGVLVTSVITSGKFYGILISVLSVLIFNFMFTEPRFTLQVYDPTYPVTFLVMFIASIISSKLATRVKLEAQNSASMAYRTAVLLETSQKLQMSKSEEEILKETVYQIRKLLDRTIILYKKSSSEFLEPFIFKKDIEINSNLDKYLTEEEHAVAEWVFKNKKHAGATTNTLPGAKCLYISIRNYEKSFAVIAIPIEKNEILNPFEKNLLIAVLGESALALEKDEINQKNNEIKIKAEQEKLRANLLRAISHDLRTPLTSISGSAGILMKDSNRLSYEKRKELYADIYDDSIWLIDLIENLLSITRIENGSMNIKTEPELIDEVIKEALLHVNRKKSEYNIETLIEDDLLMAKMDSRLIIQVIINIVNNAIKYTPVGSNIKISAMRKKSTITVEISDSGEGIEDSVKDKLFDMFFTINDKHGDGRRGLGLGLALCKSIINAHGGEIYVRNNVPRGSIFGFSLQSEEVSMNE